MIYKACINCYGRENNDFQDVHVRSRISMYVGDWCSLKLFDTSLYASSVVQVLHTGTQDHPSVRPTPSRTPCSPSFIRYSGAGSNLVSWSGSSDRGAHLDLVETLHFHWRSVFFLHFPFTDLTQIIILTSTAWRNKMVETPYQYVQERMCTVSFLTLASKNAWPSVATVGIQWRRQCWYRFISFRIWDSSQACFRDYFEQ